ncbi:MULTISPECIES: heavy metal translocating P-type ATPase [Microcella]|uniref:heavy metal translocating P-type ATPase n=1 Tax=Microcella TaxID=337004 RepID=UPI0015CF67BB|nr:MULTISPECIES: heavy metal translocating P-type ATPase [Microcella]QOD94279.1 heavy metal translocating P-type ATPase [Chryseoglobus sp. 28M-23]
MAHDHAHHDHAGHDAAEQDGAVATREAPHGHGAHGDHTGHDPAQFRRKFWLSLALTVPILVFSPGLQSLLGLDGPRFPGSEFISAGLGAFLFFYGGWVFLRGAWVELRQKQPGMMTLISLAIVVAFGYSAAVTLGLDGMDFWWELATLITIMLLGHWLEMSAVMGAQNALGELAALIPDEAELVDGDDTRTVAASELAVGDRVIVRPGSAIPADGTVVDGESDVDESLLTGESEPIGKQTGDSVVAGSVVGGGSLTVEVTKTGEDTALAGVMKLVADAQSSKSGTQLLADRAAALLFYLALAAAIITAIVWVIVRPGEPDFVLARVVTVLVIACPHALGLAIPLVAQISTSRGAKRGLLIRSRAALEAARSIDVVLFDKTGTLTEGRQGVETVVVADGVDEDEAVALAAAVEAKSEHPIARAIIAEAADRDLKKRRSARFTAVSGKGVTARVGETEYSVASGRWVTEQSIEVPGALVAAAREAGEAGQTVVYLLEGDTVLALFAIADVIRPESREAVTALQKRGVRVALLTGDSQPVAEWVGRELGIDEVHAEVLPGQKSDVVAELQRGGTSVMMVGDGVNDAPALARADVGVAIGAGTDVAIESAGIVLASSDPRGVDEAIQLSRRTYAKMQQNLVWAAGYNVVGIPLAAGVLAGVGFLPSPALGAVLMSVSTIVVALNAQLLRRG